LTTGLLGKEFMLKGKSSSIQLPVRGIGAIILTLFMSGFFIIHYGGFMAGHLFFIFALFGPEQDIVGGSSFIPWDLVWTGLSTVGVGIAVLFVSHGFSFLKNFVGRKRYNELNPQGIMFGPYKRIILMHITLIASGFVVMALGAKIIGLIIMIVLKIFSDARAHGKEHNIFGLKQQKV